MGIYKVQVEYAERINELIVLTTFTQAEGNVLHNEIVFNESVEVL